MNYKEVVKNQYVQLGTAFGAGLLICWVLYPSKQIEQKIKDEYQLKIEQQASEFHKVNESLVQERNTAISQVKDIKASFSSTVSQLETQIKEMSSRKISTYHKITNADGSSEEWQTVESEERSSQQLISDIKSRYDQKLEEQTKNSKVELEITKKQLTEEYSQIITSLKQEIKTHEEQATTITNTRKLGLEVGYTTNFQPYLHGTYNLLGPIFVGSYIEGYKSISVVGIGLGINL
jgi:hypothetical protein